MLGKSYLKGKKNDLNVEVSMHNHSNASYSVDRKQTEFAKNSMRTENFSELDGSNLNDSIFSEYFQEGEEENQKKLMLPMSLHSFEIGFSEKVFDSLRNFVKETDFHSKKSNQLYLTALNRCKIEHSAKISKKSEKKQFFLEEYLSQKFEKIMIRFVCMNSEFAPNEINDRICKSN